MTCLDHTKMSHRSCRSIVTNINSNGILFNFNFFFFYLICIYSIKYMSYIPFKRRIGIEIITHLRNKICRIQTKHETVIFRWLGQN